MRAEDYVAIILDQKQASIRQKPLSIGEFVFDYAGDLIGFYVGPNQVMLYSDLMMAYLKILKKVEEQENVDIPKGD
jgi:hypothetical protein